MILEGKKILLGITGGIAAYKTAELARKLRKEKAEVQAVLTAAAQQFITPETLAVLTERPVGLDLWDNPPSPEVRHIVMADWAELALLAPATANLLGKVAAGIADDLLTSTVLALQCPVIFAPAMHSQMWSHPAVQRNLKTLESFGYKIIPPEEGELASGDVGIGRMPEPETIVAFLQTL